MLFNSYEFILAFLPFVYLIFLMVKNDSKLTITWLCCASLFFYGWWDPSYLPLIGLSITFNFFCLKALSRWTHNLFFLWLGISVNLGLLFYYKYSSFIFSELSIFFPHSFFESKSSIILPLAISFYTFQQVGTLIDTYYLPENKVSFVNYALYVVFFPQLIAGPIVKLKDMNKQFSSFKFEKCYGEFFYKGIFLFSMGLFKKVMIADHVAIFTYSVFEHTGDMSDISLIEAWIGSLGYTFQLYFDFSGYSDMACGLALCFGITLPINFNSPYKALNISDFWKRWHISLSNWFMSYFYTTIYIKWGRVHFPKSSPYILPILTMTFIGIWHGSGYTFIACGLLHGILLCLHQAYKNTKLSRHFHHNKIYSLFCWSLTFLATVHSIVFFRAKDLEQSFDIFNAMWLKNGIGIPYHIYFRYESWLSPLSKPDYVWLSPPNFLFWFALCSCLCFFSPNSQSWFTQGPIKKLSWKPSPIFAIISAALLASSLFSMTKESEFLYFQF